MKVMALGAIVLVLVVAMVGDIPLSAQDETPDPPVCQGAQKPWNCGSIEHACSRTGHRVEGDETKYWHACNCRHRCKAGGKPDDETQGREWDARCSARCRTWHCHCPHPCQQT